MKYNRNKIEELDPRQIIYVKMHNEQYGTEALVLNGETYLERCKKNRPTEKDIKEALVGYEDREAFLDCNLRGWAIVFRTESSEKLRNDESWTALEKIQ